MELAKIFPWIRLIFIALSVSALLPAEAKGEKKEEAVLLERHPLYPEGADLAISGLAYDPEEDIYWATSDRGAGDRKDAFFQPRLYQLKMIERFNVVTFLESPVLIADRVFLVIKIIPLVNEDGSPARGFLDDPKRIDPGGIALAGDGTLWLVDEYGPYLLRVTREGKILERVLPPPLFQKRKPDQGFEGVTLSPDGKILYAALESAPQGASDPNRAYIAAYDLEKRTFRIYAYDVTDPRSLSYPDGVKAAIGISGLETVSDHALLVVERDNQAGKNARLKRLYLVDLRGADSERPATKILYADLYALGYMFEKPGGVAIRDDKAVVIVNNNDAVLGLPTEVSVLWGEDFISSKLASLGEAL